MLQPRDKRFPLIQPGVMHIEGRPGDAYVVTVLDVSKSGLRVSCSSALPIDTRVEVKCRGAAVLGDVRYSRNVGRDEFHLGIKAHDISAGARPEDGQLDLTVLFRPG